VSPQHNVKLMLRSAESSSEDESAHPVEESGRSAAEIERIILQQWQVVQHCFSENVKKVNELNAKVQRLSASLEHEKTFSAGLDACLKDLSENLKSRFAAIDETINVQLVSERRLAAIDETIKEQLVSERQERERQLQALEEIVVFQLYVFEEGLSRENTAREESNAQLLTLIEEERAVRREMLRQLACEKEPPEHSGDKNEKKEANSCLSSARSCIQNSSSGERLRFCTPPKFRSDAGLRAAAVSLAVNARMTPTGRKDKASSMEDSAASHQSGSPPLHSSLPSSSPVVSHGTSGTSNTEEGCRKQAAGKRFRVFTESPASLTGTWRPTSNGWTRASLPAQLPGNRQEQEQQQQMHRRPSFVHTSPQGLSPHVSTPGNGLSVDCALLGVGRMQSYESKSPRLVPVEVTQLPVQHQYAQVQQPQQSQQPQQPQLQQQQLQQPQQQQRQQQFNQVHEKCWLQIQTQHSLIPCKSLVDLPAREQTHDGCLPISVSVHRSSCVQRSSSWSADDRSMGTKGLLTC